MNRLMLGQRESNAGEFVIFSEQCSFSIGDYIEVFLREPPYATGEIFLSRPVFALPLTVVECCHNAEITVILRHRLGVSMHHWIQCLDIGKVSVIVPFEYRFKGHTWYMPKIDGWVPGMFGRVRAPSLKSELRR